MFNAQSLISAALIAATTVTTVWGKAQAVLYFTDNCISSHSSTIGMSTGVCHSTFFSIVNPGGASAAGYASSVQFYTDGAVEDYLYYSDTDCNDVIQESLGPSVCVLLANGVKSFKKKALIRLLGYGQNERKNVSAANLRALVRASKQLTALWMQTTSPYSPDLMVCASAAVRAGAAAVDAVAGVTAPAPSCTAAHPLRSIKAHQKLIHESGIADDYIWDPLCGFQVLIEADWGAEGYCYYACVERQREVWSNRREKT
ncbi:hypothetical protein DFH08DRAFT_950661 [Mycena albidolilacea]|uniref:Uncharacterized protein n=1 Tax=Mycena albidolilacea TaxID=1033008 RepID=A0AAD7AM48_9AGAR|nr:hypothetical protein DFH08DRAFT_950661 [Mycena albidolilacea]